MLCFDCKFFHVVSGKELTEDDWREDLDGECRRHTPALGEIITRQDGDEERWYGEWPRVMAGNWCGEFEPREAREAQQG